MDFSSSTRAAENRTRWRGLLQINLWYLEDLLRLWDRIQGKEQNLTSMVPMETGIVLFNFVFGVVSFFSIYFFYKM